MTPESSPFRPGQPVPIEFFVGRRPEIERLRGMVNASAQGRFKIGFVSGERGIGKSSLVAFVRHLVESDHDVAGCHVFLGGVQDLREMLRRTFDRILKESIDKSWHQQLINLFGDRVSKVGLFGVTLELNLAERDLSAMERDFVPSVRPLLESIKEHKKSLFLILDDINGLANSESFANWLKSTSILRKMADEPRTHFRRAELQKLLTATEKKGLDSFLRRMTKLGALEKDPEVRGGYRFPNLLHALYFWMEAQRRRREE